MVTARKFKCLVFDFDGTLADTFEQAFEIQGELAGIYGFRKLNRDEIAKVREMSAMQFMNYLNISRLKLPKILTHGKRLLSERLDSVTPIKGIGDVLPTLRPQFEIFGILTSNSKENVYAFLERHELSSFEFVSTVPKLSGKAKNLKAIMRAFTLKAEEILFIGDELRDLKAAGKARVGSAAVTWGFNAESSLKLLKPDFVFRDPNEMLQLLNHAGG